MVHVFYKSWPENIFIMFIKKEQFQEPSIQTDWETDTATDIVSYYSYELHNAKF